MNATELGFAVLFSLPVGIGVSMGTWKAAGGGLSSPLVVGTGALAALGVFVLVLAGVAVGSVADDGDPAGR
ncbi:hypothetical protein BRC90_11115 [Halobacteriales archaeon QS_4_69_34]|jgi:hypothetical protein|nr:MAG: hypothetical protein BRC90_11115 [Halobacteriales archaeon QS_4_69_34]